MRIQDTLERRIPEVGSLSDAHDVRVRETPAGLVVNYHCLADPSLPVDEVHAKVDELERRVRQECRSIARIVGHAEPIKARDHR